MSHKRTLIIAIATIVIVLVALALVALWLFGQGGTGQVADERGPSASDTGIVFVKTIDAAAGARLLTPVGIGAGSDGGFFVTLRDNARVIEFDARGEHVRSWGERGLGAGQLMVPLGVAVDRAGGRVYVTDRSRLRLLCYDLEGTLRWEVPVLNPLTPAVTPDGVAVTTFGPVALFDAEGVLRGEFGSRGEVPGQFDYARGIVAAGDDGAFIADTNNARVQRITFSGEATATVEWVYGRPPLNQDDATTLFGVPAGITTDDDGLVYVLDGFRAEVTVLEPSTGEELHRFVFTTGSASGQVYMPSGIAHLGDDTFALTDTANDRVQIFRLLLPAENTVIARSPWLWWLLVPALAPLLLLFGRKRWFVTAETLEQATADGRLRLLAAVLKRMAVLPEVAEAYRDASEEGLSIAGYLRTTDPDGATDDEEARLAAVARRGARDRLLLRRHRLVCADEEQAERFRRLGCTSVVYADVLEGYVLEGEGRRGA